MLGVQLYAAVLYHRHLLKVGYAKSKPEPTWNEQKQQLRKTNHLTIFHLRFEFSQKPSQSPLSYSDSGHHDLRAQNFFEEFLKQEPFKFFSKCSLIILYFIMKGSQGNLLKASQCVNAGLSLNDCSTSTRPGMYSSLCSKKAVKALSFCLSKEIWFDLSQICSAPTFWHSVICITAGWEKAPGTSVPWPF